MEIEHLYLRQHKEEKSTKAVSTQADRGVPVERYFVDQEEVERLHAQVRLMEARIQTLTEDGDIIRRELEVTNSWYDNQQELIRGTEQLAEANAKLTQEKMALEDKLSLIQSKFERLQAVLRAQARARPVIQQGTFTPLSTTGAAPNISYGGR